MSTGPNGEPLSDVYIPTAGAPPGHEPPPRKSRWLREHGWQPDPADTFPYRYWVGPDGTYAEFDAALRQTEYPYPTGGA